MRTSRVPTIVAALCVTAAVSLAACRNDQRTGTTTSAIQARDARTGIADARCDWEQRCDRIGAERQYADRSACTAGVEQGWRDELNFADCPGGVDAAKLGECLTEIRNAECGSIVDRMERFVACRVNNLCKR